MYVQVISEFNIGHKKNSIHYPVEHFFKAAREEDTRTKWLIDWLLLQFTTARYKLRRRVITIYNRLVITILDNCYCNLQQVLQLHGTIRNDDF